MKLEKLIEELQTLQQSLTGIRNQIKTIERERDQTEDPKLTAKLAALRVKQLAKELQEKKLVSAINESPEANKMRQAQS